MSFESPTKQGRETCNEEARDELRALVRNPDDEQMHAELRAHPCYEALREEWLESMLPADGRTYGEALRLLPLTGEDYDTALALWIHDPITGAHSVKTALLIELVLEHSPLLREKIQAEGASVLLVVRAGVNHDKGKLDIPSEVLGARPTDTECMSMLKQAFEEKDPETLTLIERLGIESTTPWSALEHELQTKRIRPVCALPVRLVVSSAAIDALEQSGIATEGRSLPDIIGAHEEHTRRRLSRDPMLADIASHHHTPHQSEYPTAAGTVGVSSGISKELLHLVDIVEAVTATRPYKEGRPLVDALVAEIEDARAENISREVLDEVLRVFEETDGMRLAHEYALDASKGDTLNNLLREEGLPEIVPENLSDQRAVA